STSESKRMVVDTLAFVFTLPAGRPRLRAAICAGVCTAACSPRFISSMDLSTSGSFILGIYRFLQFHQKGRCQVVELGLRVDRQQHQTTPVVAVEIDHAGAAALPHAGTGPTDRAQTACALDHVAGLCVRSDPCHKSSALPQPNFAA